MPAWPSYLIRSRPAVVALATTGVGIFLAFAVWAVVIVPEQQADNLRESLPVTTTVAMLTDIADARNSTRTTNAQIVVGILVVLTLGATFWRAWAADQTAKATLASSEAAMRTATASQRSADASMEAQLADRFAKAVEQLADGNVTVRLGGIYSLESIARASETHHWPIMETLTSYVRDHSPRSRSNETAADTGDELKPATDIQTILTVIGRREVGFDPRNSRLDLQDCDLRGANLVDAQLSKVSLSRSSLAFAKLHGANLTDAHLIEVNLYRASLGGATLTGAMMFGAEAEEAHDLSSEMLIAARVAQSTKLPPETRQRLHELQRNKRTEESTRD